MTRPQRRLALLATVLVAMLIFFALLYQVGMSRLEGKPRDFWSSLAWSAETLSTTGFGADSHWNHPAMVLLVVLVQFAGIFLVFLVVPIYLIPFLEERFERRLPSKAPKVKGHVVIVRSGPAVETLFDDLDAAGVVAVVAEADEARARRLAERGQTVVLGSVNDGVLAGCRLADARALVLNGSDEENALAALVARQSGYAGDVIALVADPAHRKPIHLAGANRVFTPRHALGAALAARASRRVHSSVSGLGALGSMLNVAELRISAASVLAGTTLAASEVSSRFGVTILGLWERGHFITGAGPETRLDVGSIVIAAGSAERLRAFGEIATASTFLAAHGRFVIAGLGEVGKAARDVLITAGEEVVTVDRHADSGADIVGDFLDPEIVARIDPTTASAIILALDQDAPTLFAALVVRDLAPQAPIIARVNDIANVERIHLAGADFALSISQVAGQILGHRILGEESIAVEPGLRVSALSTKKATGRTLAELALRERAGCSAVAIERGDELLVQLTDGTRIQAGDRLLVCGDTAALRRAASLIGEILSSSGRTGAATAVKP